MRKGHLTSNSPILKALFPTIRQHVLSATFNQPSKWWYLSELAVALGTVPSSLQRELPSLIGAGILEQYRDGTRAYFRPQPMSPIYEDLSNIFRKTLTIFPASVVPESIDINLAVSPASLVQTETIRSRSLFPYARVAKMWNDGMTISQIARSIDLIDKKKDCYHSLRNFIRIMHKGYKDDTGKILKLPYRISARTLERTTEAGMRATTLRRAETAASQCSE